jgi:molybdopterin adenylyltransferase
MNIGILTISDRGSRGEYEDRSGPLIATLIKDRTPWQISHQAIIPDEFDTIVKTLIVWSDEGVNLLLTSGGTGFAPRDITPEATRRVIERETPGIVEAIRAESLKITKHAMLSRAMAGIRKQTLIINMPGNPKAVRENLDVLLPVLPHALELIVGSSGTESQHRTV